MNVTKGNTPIWVATTIATSTLGFAAWAAMAITHIDTQVAVDSNRISTLENAIPKLEQDHDIIIRIAEKFDIPINTDN